MEKYEIGTNTLAVIGINQNRAKIVEYGRDFVVNSNSYDVMDYSCCYYGSSYNGRAHGSKVMLNCEYKLPIIIEETREIIFFPTESPSINSCTWISLEMVDSIDGNNKSCWIHFKNGKKLKIGRSKDSIENQIYRATRLKFILGERKQSYCMKK